MTKYIWRNGEFIDAKTGAPMDVPDTPIFERNVYAMSDITPFISPIDRTEISSRSALRDHEAKHGVKQVGNDYASDNRRIKERAGLA